MSWRRVELGGSFYGTVSRHVRYMGVDHIQFEHGLLVLAPDDVSLSAIYPLLCIGRLVISYP